MQNLPQQRERDREDTKKLDSFNWERVKDFMAAAMALRRDYHSRRNYVDPSPQQIQGARAKGYWLDEAALLTSTSRIEVIHDGHGGVIFRDA